MRRRVTGWLAALVLASPLALGVLALSSPLASVQADDDDDDDDDGDNGGGGSIASPGAAFSPQRVARRPAAARRAPPEVAPDEVVVRGLDAATRGTLLALGFGLARESGDLLLLTIPAGDDVEGALAEIAGLSPSAIAAPNAYYRNQQDETPPCTAPICTDYLTLGLEASCAATPFIGVVDTGINLEHAALVEADISVERFGAAPEPPSDVRHGTAVAALFVGSRDSRTPGLVPEARLLVADPFDAEAGDLRSDTFSLVTAIDALVDAGVDAINLSLAGPRNAVLESSVDVAITAGIPLAAAVGNAGPRAAPLYPSAYAGVVGVTALDRRDRIYRRAIQGSHVDLAAPGVQLSVAASVRGMRPQTGTSFAVPFVTLALALARQDDPDRPVADIASALGEEAVDLGEPGRDDVFGWGRVALQCPER